MALPLIGLAAGIGSSVMGFMGQQQAADNQNAYYTANAKAANQAAVNSYAYQQNALVQKSNAALQQKQQTSVEALKARSAARVSSGEAGVTGLSVDAIIGDYYGQEGRRMDSIDQNYEMDRDYLRAEMESTQAQTTSRINSVQRVEGPSPLGLLFKIGSNVAGYGAATSKSPSLTSTQEFAT
jgi:hypothetical protein